MEPTTTITPIDPTGAFLVKKLLGPTLEYMGNSLPDQLFCRKNRDKIVEKAIKKTKNIASPGQTNLRVTRDVFWNGSFTDESICAEYFGGILASSRSEDGKDDSGIFYVDIIKSLPSHHLKMHYIIYRTLNKELITNKKKKELNPGSESALNREHLFFPFFYIIEQFNNAYISAILHGLYSKNLIGKLQFYNYQHEGEVEVTIPYLNVSPTPLGIQLFAIANNMFDDWLNFPKLDFGDFADVTLPKYYAQSMNKLIKRIGSNYKEVIDPESP